MCLASYLPFISYSFLLTATSYRETERLLWRDWKAPAGAELILTGSAGPISLQGSLVSVATFHTMAWRENHPHETDMIL